MKSKLLTASLLATFLFAGLGLPHAMAQNTNSPGADRAQQAISARIQQDLDSGHIWPSEMQEPYGRDRDIAPRESYYKSKGTATGRMANRNLVGNSPGSTHRIDQQAYRISQRIDQGVRSGHIPLLANRCERAGA